MPWADFSHVFDNMGTMHIDDAHQVDPGNKVITARSYALIRPQVASLRDAQGPGR